MHNGTQFVALGEEIYKFSIDGKFSLKYKKKCLDDYFNKVNEINKTLSEGKDWD